MLNRKAFDVIEDTAKTRKTKIAICPWNIYFFGFANSHTVPKCSRRFSRPAALFTTEPFFSNQRRSEPNQSKKTSRIFISDPTINTALINLNSPTERGIFVLILTNNWPKDLLGESAACVACLVLVKPRANGRNIVAWPSTPNIVGCYMLRPFVHPVVCCWELLRPFEHYCQLGCYNSQHRWPDKVGSYCVWLHVAYGVFPGHHIHVFRWHIRWDHVTRNARSHTKTPNLFCFSATCRKRESSLPYKKKTLTQGSYSLSSSNSMTFHDLFKFSMKLGLVVTFKNFPSFPSLGVFFDLTQFNRHKLWCSPKCVPCTLLNYSSLPCIVLALSSAVTKLPNKTLIWNS